VTMALFFIQTGAPVEGMLFESPCPYQGAAQGAQEFTILIVFCKSQTFLTTVP
jgi:hypothetical protein